MYILRLDQTLIQKSYPLKNLFAHCLLKVHIVLNPHGIEPTFLKLKSWSLGEDSIPILTSNVSKYIKKERMFGKNMFYKQ